MAVVKRVCWTVDEFIERATHIHNGKYDYSLINSDITARTKVSIKCNTCEHIFEQRVGSHINSKCGCPACTKTLKWNPTRFVERATQIYNGKYDYSLIDLSSKINSKSKVSIKCNTCKYIFEQRVCDHIYNKYCRCLCARTFRWTVLEFIRYATYIHNNKYDYRMIDINSKINSSTRVIIKCKTCYCIFKSMVRNHIHNKSGCPKCSFLKE